MNSELKKNIRDVVYLLLQERKSSIISIIISLAFIAVSQSLFIFSIGPFLKVFFGLDRNKQFITVGELVGKNSFLQISYFDNFYFPVSALIYITPLIIFFSGSLKNIASYIYQIHVSNIGLYLTKISRDLLFDKIMHKSYFSLIMKSPAEWMSVMMNDVIYLQTKFVDIMKNLVKDVVILLSALFTMFMIHLETAMFLLLIMPIIALVMGRSSKLLAFFYESLQKEIAFLTNIILDIRKRFEFIKAQNGEHYETKMFNHHNESYFQIIRRSLLIRASFSPLSELIGFILFSILLLFSSYKILSINTHSINIVMFFATLAFILKPLKNIGAQMLQLSETKGALTHSFEILSCKDEYNHQKTSQQLQTNQHVSNYGSIKQVSCGFQKKTVVHLNNFNIIPGTAVAIVGPNGSGKSTILRTLAGLLTPIHWKANIDWLELSDKTTMVSQYPFLFNNSLLDNIIYGLPDSTNWSEQDIWNILEQVHIDEQIKSLPELLQTNFKTLGANLSGGQIQKLVIARALIRKKPIILMDEATSAIDPKSEYEISSNLIKQIKQSNQSIISVTHRAETLKLYDHIVHI